MDVNNIFHVNIVLKSFPCLLRLKGLVFVYGTWFEQHLFKKRTQKYKSSVPKFLETACVIDRCARFQNVVTFNTYYFKVNRDSASLLQTNFGVPEHRTCLHRLS